MRVICVAGARPNYMKVKPVMDALEERGAQVILVHTGQHYDPAMSEVFFDDLAIRRPDHFLGAGSGSHAVQTCRVMTAFEPLAFELAADVVVVVGDVNSTLACALVTAKLGVPLAHVEAGLRSRDRSMPEEINRLVTDRVSDYLFAPSADAVANLRAEGFGPRADTPGRQRHGGYPAGERRPGRRAGDAGRARPAARAVRPGDAAPAGQRGRPGCAWRAVGGARRDLPLGLPARAARPSARGRPAARRGAPRAVRIIPPLGYLDFIALEASARLVLTDSGGVQEETTVLGVPCLTLGTAPSGRSRSPRAPTGWSGGTRTGSSPRPARCSPAPPPRRGRQPCGTGRRAGG